MHVRVVNTHITTNYTTPRQIFTLKFSCTCDISLQRWEDMRRAMCAEKALDNLDLVICYNIASCYPLIIFFFFQTATNYRSTRGHSQSSSCLLNYHTVPSDMVISPSVSLQFGTLCCCLFSQCCMYM